MWPPAEPTSKLFSTKVKDNGGKELLNEMFVHLQE